jgi:hypothetical protein
MMRAPGEIGRENPESPPDWVPREPFRFAPRALPQGIIQTPLERTAGLFPSLVEPAIDRPTPRAPPFVIPINDRWMASESQAEPARPPFEFAPPPLRRSGPEVFRNDPSNSANPLSPRVPGYDEPRSRSIHGGVPLFSEQRHSSPIHTSGDVINFLIGLYHITMAFNSHRFPDDNPSIVCIVIAFPTITFS